MFIHTHRGSHTRTHAHTHTQRLTHTHTLSLSLSTHTRAHAVYMFFEPDINVYQQKVREEVGDAVFARLRFFTHGQHNHEGPGTHTAPLRVCMRRGSIVRLCDFMFLRAYRPLCEKGKHRVSVCSAHRPRMAGGIADTSGLGGPVNRQYFDYLYGQLVQVRSSHWSTQPYACPTRTHIHMH
jgi:hypothetical protein